MKILYQVNMKMTPGYGYRLWVKRSDLTDEIKKGLSEYSMWGGFDKTDDDMVSFEIGTQRRLFDAINFLNIF